MSGRDLRAFLASHKASTFKTTNNEAKLVGGYLAGVTKKNIKQVDYDHLLASVKQHRASGQKQLKRVKKLSKISKDSKENSLLKTHHEAWDRMHAQLVSAKVKYQIEVEMWKSKQLEDSGDESLKVFVLECTDLESQLYNERTDFERETVEPIWSLRIDLKGWLHGNSSPEEDRDQSSVAKLQGHEEILEQLKLVKEQQNRIQELLEAEYDMLQLELDGFLSESHPSHDAIIDDRGIPQEALDLECPDVELKESALQEFLMVDDHYRTLLSQLKQSNEEVLRCEYGGWSRYDAEKYQLIMEQYPSSSSSSSTLPNRRAVVIDRVKRELPSKTRADIVAHESWCSAKTHYDNMKKTYLKSWEQSRRELLVRVAAAFAEAEREYEAKKLAMEERGRQLELCRELCEKVSAWRRAKLESARAEAELEAQRYAEEQHKKQLEETQKRIQREKEKVKIQAYRADIKRCNELEREAAAERERLVEGERKKRLKHDRERVEFRQMLEGEREVERREREAKVMEEERKRERRLAELRQQVQVNIATDPLRVLRETKSTHARQEALCDLRPEFDLQQPLFSLHTFTDSKVTSDLRFKVGEALRKAGLHTTGYGRRILASLPPSQPPRPDQLSSLFRDK